MKKIVTLIISLCISTSVFANNLSNQCDSLKGNWQWNGTVNEWQCLDGNGSVLKLVAQQEQGTSDENQPSGWSQKSIGEKAVIVAAAPVVAAGFVVASVVVAPVYIIKKIFN